MNTHSILGHAAIAVMLLASANLAFGQLGNDNPTGVTGQFNGNSMTGCSFDPFTGNATRTVHDLQVAQDIGKYPLRWSRILNSRKMGTGDSHFGPNGWSNSYAWTASTDQTTGSLPASYTVSYPDGRIIYFTASTKGDTVYNGPAGIRDRFQQVSNDGECFLLLTDGGKVQFHQKKTTVAPGEVFFTLTLKKIIDPTGLETIIDTDINGAITKITEPGGRWIKISYVTPNGNIQKVDAGYGTNTITQTVTYSYGTFSAPPYNYTVLLGASYNDGTSATYTYCASNLTSGGWPLVRTCDDVRYAGPMKRIGYSYATGAQAVYGQIASENYYDGNTPAASPTPVPTPVVALTVNTSANTRTETRGDGAPNNPSRTFKYGSANKYSDPSFSVPQSYLLADVTDFKAKDTYLSYDTNSYINKIRDARGNIAQYTRLALTGNISVMTHPDPSPAPTIKYFYTDTTTGYYVDHIVDELNHTPVQYTRDTNHRITRIDYPDTGYETFTYNSLGQVLTHRTTSGGTYQYGYSTRGALLTVTDPNNGLTTYGYDANDHTSSVQDARGNTTVTTYDVADRLMGMAHPSPSPSSVAWTYYPDSTLHTVTDELGHVTSYVYDDYKRLKEVDTPLRGSPDPNPTPKTFFWYDTNASGVDDYTHTDSNVTRVDLPSNTQANPKQIRSIYDANFWRSSVTTGYNTGSAATTSFTYDDVGNLQTVKEPNAQPSGPVWTYNYDQRNRLTSVDSPLVGTEHNSQNHTISRTYDATSNVLSILRTNDQLITNDSFDAMNRVLQRTAQLGPSPSPPAVSKYTYYTSGLLNTFKDPKLVKDNADNGTNYAYTYTYDTLGRLTNLQYPPDANNLQKNEAWTYDAAWNLRTFTNRDGKVLTITYDERNRPTLRDWSDTTPDVTFVYDNANRLTNINSANATYNANISRQYYNDNLLYTETRSTNLGDASRTVTYVYDLDGNRQTITYPGPSPVPAFSYGYTPRNELDNINAGDAANPWINYLYDASGNRTHRKVNFAAGVPKTDTVYGTADALNRIPSISTAFTSGGTQRFDYGFDVLSRLKYEQRNSGTADGYTYDLADQITQFNQNGTLSGGAVSGGSIMSLTFDLNGNRKQTIDPVHGTINYALDALNQYTADLNGAATYDNKGNQATSGDGSSYTHDAQNRLTRVQKAGVDVMYYYDGLNRQVARDENGSSNRTYSVWDGWSLIQEYNSSGTLLNNYVQDAGMDEMVARFGTSNANRIWYYQDGRGNTSHIANDAGALVETCTYDLGGKPSVNTISPYTQTNNRFLYNARDYSSLTNLYDFRFRFYRHDISRFLQPDPIGFAGDPTNLYRYVGNNMPNRNDPLGLEEITKIRNAADSIPTVEPVIVFGREIAPGESPWVSQHGPTFAAGGGGGGRAGVRGGPRGGPRGTRGTSPRKPGKGAPDVKESIEADYPELDNLEGQQDYVNSLEGFLQLTGGDKLLQAIGQAILDLFNALGNPFNAPPPSVPLTPIPVSSSPSQPGVPSPSPSGPPPPR